MLRVYCVNTKMKPNNIYNKDCLLGVNKIPNSRIHCIISDIPYGINFDTWDVKHDNTNSALLNKSPANRNNQLFSSRGKPINGWSQADKLIANQYQEFCQSFALDWFRVLKPGATAFVFSSRRYLARVILAFEEVGFNVRDILAFIKPKAPFKAQRVSEVLKRRKYSNYKKYEKYRLGNLAPLFEPIIWFHKPYKQGTTLVDNFLEHGIGVFNSIPLAKGISYRNSNVLKVEYDKDDYGLHPTQKPLKLCKFLIALVTQKNQIVLDPFAGSGTTLLAAKELGRKYIGFELNKEYYKVACERVEK